MEASKIENEKSSQEVAKSISSATVQRQVIAGTVELLGLCCIHDSYLQAFFLFQSHRLLGAVMSPYFPHRAMEQVKCMTIISPQHEVLMC